MEELLVKIIENSLDALDKLTVWIFSSFIVILLSLFSQKEEFLFGGVSIKRKYTGTILYAILCGLIFYIFKLLNNLSDAYYKLSILKHTGNDALDKANQIIHNHTWVFNPFSQTEGRFSFIVDNLGYPLLIVIWWFGNALAQATLSSHNNFLRLLGFLCAGLYLIFGLGCMLEIGELTPLICKDNYIKMGAPFLGIIIGGILFFIIVSIAKKIKSKEMQQPV